MTDETAKAILDLPNDAIINLSVPTHSTFPQYEGYSQPLDVKIERIELQRMAKLWLLLPRIRRVVNSISHGIGPDSYPTDGEFDLQKQLAALEDK